MQNDLAYYQDPKNGDGITRSRTIKLIRAWEIPRSEKVLEIIHKEFNSTQFPGLYILIEGKNKIYIGEAKNIYNRLKTHLNQPEEKIAKWAKALVINDGRIASQSDLSDSAIRKALEYFFIIIFKANKYQVLSQGEYQNLNAQQRIIFDAFKDEAIHVLLKMNYITKLPEESGQEEVFRDDLKKIIIKTGRKINKWANYEAIINGDKVFIRPGSKKPKGWQITFRGRKPGSFIDSLQKGCGSLLVARNGVLLIPLSEVQKVITDKSAYDQDTIDIWIVFAEDKITLSYKNNSIDVFKFKLLR